MNAAEAPEVGSLGTNTNFRFKTVQSRDHERKQQPSRQAGAFSRMHLDRFQDIKHQLDSNNNHNRNPMVL